MECECELMCFNGFPHMDSRAWSWERLGLGSERGFGFSSISMKIVHMIGVPTVVRSCGDLSNWARAGIGLPLVILSNLFS